MYIHRIDFEDIEEFTHRCLLGCEYVYEFTNLQLLAYRIDHFPTL